MHSCERQLVSIINMNMYLTTQWLDHLDGLYVPVIKEVYKLFQLTILRLHFRLHTPRHGRHFPPPREAVRVSVAGGAGGGAGGGQEGGTKVTAQWPDVTHNHICPIGCCHLERRLAVIWY